MGGQRRPYTPRSMEGLLPFSSLCSPLSRGHPSLVCSFERRAGCPAHRHSLPGSITQGGCDQLRESLWTIGTEKVKNPGPQRKNPSETCYYWNTQNVPGTNIGQFSSQTLLDTPWSLAGADRCLSYLFPLIPCCAQLANSPEPANTTE